jgi:hypothetical protein
MSIVTDSRRPDEPKSPDSCNVFALYRHVATADEVESLAGPYESGSVGYRDAKEMLLDAHGRAGPFARTRWLRDHPRRLGDDHVEDLSFGEVAAKCLASSDAVYGSSDSARPITTWGFWSGDSLGVVDRRECGAQGRRILWQPMRRRRAVTVVGLARPDVECDLILPASGHRTIRRSVECDGGVGDCRAGGDRPGSEAQ